MTKIGGGPKLLGLDEANPNRDDLCSSMTSPQEGVYTALVFANNLQVGSIHKHVPIGIYIPLVALVFTNVHHKFVHKYLSTDLRCSVSTSNH